MNFFKHILLFAFVSAFSGDFLPRAVPQSEIDWTDTKEWREQITRDIVSLEAIILSIGGVIFMLILITSVTVALRGWYSKRTNQYRVRSNLDVMHREQALNFNRGNRGESYL